MSVKGTIGKTVVLLFLIVILAFLGIFWFDYLGVIQAKQVFAPVYKLLGLQTQTSVSTTTVASPDADLESDRLAKRLEALDLVKQQLEKRETDVTKKEAENLQIAQELDDRRKAQEERESTFNSTLKKYDDRELNIIQNAKNLTSMIPKNAVDILLAMDDQDVIDIMRKVEEIAQSKGAMSMVPNWLQSMPAERAAQIQRKMTNKPPALN